MSPDRASSVTTVTEGGASLPSFLFLLADDIGWGDFGWNDGTAATPNLDKWAHRPGSIVLQDFHTGGTVCAPTRATILTGRNHFRDCMNYVYDCSDMTECVPTGECMAGDAGEPGGSCSFAPQRTFTVADAVRNAISSTDTRSSYKSFFGGKWHLGSFYNDSESYGGVTSSPLTHGFDSFNATVEVAPTATTNCMCQKEWSEECLFGHNDGPVHCNGGPNPGGEDLPDGCCFNYWWENTTAEHGVSNLTWSTGDDDALYVADSFDRFLATRAAAAAPFFSQLSFHNCHIPFIGTPDARERCRSGETCALPLDGAPAYSDAELDYYSCLTELDNSVGKVLTSLDTHGYGPNTLVWFTTDNGPEVNCPPLGICAGTEARPLEGPGSTGPFRGRKRDVFEGGHRVPALVSWPSVVKGPPRESWDFVTTMDFLPTVMEILGVERPLDQQSWAMDGRSILPLLKGENNLPPHGMGWWYFSRTPDSTHGFGFRYGDWKYIQGSFSCTLPSVCGVPQLYNLSSDPGEREDLSAAYPEVLKDLMARFSSWNSSVAQSREVESYCDL